MDETTFLYRSDLISVTDNPDVGLLHCFIAHQKPKSFYPGETDLIVAHVKRRTGYTIELNGGHNEQ